MQLMRGDIISPAKTNRTLIFHFQKGDTIPLITKGLISKIYNCISSLKNTSLSKMKVDLENKLGEIMEEKSWNFALQRINDSTSCTKLNIIQFKVAHQAHFSKAKLSKIYPEVDAGCDRFHNTPAQSHVLVVPCSVIFSTISRALDIELQPSAATAIFSASRRILLH